MSAFLFIQNIRSNIQLPWSISYTLIFLPSRLGLLLCIPLPSLPIGLALAAERGRGFPPSYSPHLGFTLVCGICLARLVYNLLSRGYTAVRGSAVGLISLLSPYRVKFNDQLNLMTPIWRRGGAGRGCTGHALEP